MLITSVIPLNINPDHVSASIIDRSEYKYNNHSGITTVTINATYSKTVMAGVSGTTWSTLVQTAVGNTLYSDANDTGFSTSSLSNKFTTLNRGFVGFNTSTLPANVSITSVKMYLYCDAKTYTFTSENPYVTIYHSPQGEDNTITTADFPDNYTYNNPLSTGYYLNSFSTGNWYEFDVYNNTDDLTYFDKEHSNAWGYTWVGLDFYGDTNNVQPAWESVKHAQVGFAPASGASLKPYLEISYYESVLERDADTHTNSSLNPSPTGNETATSILWSTPRAGYADEDILINVYGDSGADISLQLIDNTNTVIALHDDEVRDDGVYQWIISLPNDYFGFVRPVEVNNNLIGDYGYIMPSPSSTQEVYTTAYDTSYPQYLYNFNKYNKTVNDIMAIHWKSNVQEDELSDNSFKIFLNGTQTPVYSSTLQDMADNYYLIDTLGDSDNTFMVSSRFFLCTPYESGTGFNDYDGLIYNLNQGSVLANYGYYHPIIQDTTTNTTVTDVHSAYWFIPTLNDGILSGLSNYYPKASTTFNLSIQVGSNCKASTYLPGLSIAVMDSNGTDNISSQYSSFIVGNNTYTITAPSTSGNYRIRFNMYGDDTYVYTHDIPFTVTALSVVTTTPSSGTMVNPITEFGNWFSEKGYFSQEWKYLILIIIMVILYYVARKSKCMRVILPCIPLVIWIVLGWVEIWLVSLIAISAALGIWFFGSKILKGNNANE